MTDTVATEAVLYTYTVFTVSANGNHPTTHITSVQATDREHARKLAISETAEDWGEEEDHIAVRGIAAGSVDILEWDDEVGQ